MEQVKPRVRVFTMSSDKWFNRSPEESQNHPLVVKWDKDRTLPPGQNYTGDGREQRNYFYNYREEI